MQNVVPIQMLLWCPECRARHVDKGEFATKPHHTHACQSCGHVWRPAIGPTVGVQFLPGFKDGEPVPKPVADLAPGVKGSPDGETWARLPIDAAAARGFVEMCALFKRGLWSDSAERKVIEFGEYLRRELEATAPGAGE